MTQISPLDNIWGYCCDTYSKRIMLNTQTALNLLFHSTYITDVASLCFSLSERSVPPDPTDEGTDPSSKHWSSTNQLQEKQQDRWEGAKITLFFFPVRRLEVGRNMESLGESLEDEQLLFLFVFILTSDDKKPWIPTNHWAYCSWRFCFELQKPTMMPQGISVTIADLKVWWFKTVCCFKLFKLNVFFLKR